MLAANTGKKPMRNTLALSALVLLLSLPAWASDEKAAGKKAAVESAADTDTPYLFDACYGDRYESDEDINDGNRITEEEILKLLNPPKS